MTQLLTTQLIGHQAYSPFLKSFVLSYTKTFYKERVEWAQELTFTKHENKILKVMVEPFTHGGFRTTQDIECLLKITQRSVIIRCLPVHTFSYGHSYREALDNFKSLLIDYYKHLKARRKTLGKNLLEELEYLETIIMQKIK